MCREVNPHCKCTLESCDVSRVEGGVKGDMNGDNDENYEEVGTIDHTEEYE